MPGLPFTSLTPDAVPAETAGWGDMGAPRAQEALAGKPIVGPVWDTPPAPAAGEGGPDAFPDQEFVGLASQHTAARDAMVARIKANLKPQYDTLVAQYKTAKAALDQMGLDPRQLQQRTAELYAQYQNKWIGIKGAAQPDIEELSARTQEALTRLDAARKEKQMKLRALNELGQQFGWGPRDLLRAKYQAIGLSVPQDLLGEPSPRERLQTLKPILDEMDQQALFYRLDKKTGRMQTPIPEAQWTGGTEAKPQPTDKQWRNLTPEEHATTYTPFQREHTRIAGEFQKARQKLLGRRTPVDLVGAAVRSPLAQSITAQRPATTGTIRVVNSSGVVGSIPRSELNEALTSGYRLATGE
jgi:hypothetical protein